MEKFWMVWNKDGVMRSGRHRFEFDAVSESKRLAKLNPGSEFFVLEATKVSKTTDPVTTEDLTESEDVPF